MNLFSQLSINIFLKTIFSFKSGSLLKTLIASSLAFSIRNLLFGKLSSTKSGNPDYLYPKIWPGPLSSKSFSAI